MAEPEIFDCFLSHNSADKPSVRALAQALRARGISVWLEEERLRPGFPWQVLLEAGIRASRSVAVLVGKDGLGPWESEEMRAALSLAVRDGRPVIPVLLAGAPDVPVLPLFLGERTWVDLRSGGQVGSKSELDRLFWGITGSHPAHGPHNPESNLVCQNDDQGLEAATHVERHGIATFWRFLSGDWKLAVAAFAAATLPLADFLFSVAPPWPKGIAILTSIVQVVAVIGGFQMWSQLNRASFNRLLGLCMVFFLITLLCYLASISLLTYQAPFDEHQGSTQNQIVGLQCRDSVETVFGVDCPFLDREQIKQFEYNPEYIWTPISITASRLLLIFLWFAFFLSFAFLFSGFLSYRSRHRLKGYEN